MTLPLSLKNTITDECDDMVARRIVMRRGVWDQVAHMARELEVSASDAAVIALRAGLAEVRKVGVQGIAMHLAASLRERALQVERRADGQPAWMKGSLVFADRPVRESLPDLEPKTPPPPACAMTREERLEPAKKTTKSKGPAKKTTKGD